MVGHVLKIGTQQLLVASDDAQLHGGGQAGVLAQLGRDAALGGQLMQPIASGVTPDHTEQGGLRPQTGQVVGHVGAAPQAIFFALHVHDWHRGFGADALDRTIPVPIEHHIAHHHDARLLQLGQAGQVHSSSTRRGG